MQEEDQKGNQEKKRTVSPILNTTNEETEEVNMAWERSPL